MKHLTHFLSWSFILIFFCNTYDLLYWLFLPFLLFFYLQTLILPSIQHKYEITDYTEREIFRIKSHFLWKGWKSVEKIVKNVKGTAKCHLLNSILFDSFEINCTIKIIDSKFIHFSVWTRIIWFTRWFRGGSYSKCHHSRGKICKISKYWTFVLRNFLIEAAELERNGTKCGVRIAHVPMVI